MATTATPTKLLGVQQAGEWFEAIYSVLLDTTTNAGLQTIDLTDDFQYVEGIELLGFNDEAPYLVSFLVPDHDTAATSTNVGVYFHFSPSKTGNAENAEVFDSVDSADLSTAITGMRIKVIGRRALTTSWA